jgi:hypothetical protein
VTKGGSSRLSALIAKSSRQLEEQQAGVADILTGSLNL